MKSVHDSMARRCLLVMLFAQLQVSVAAAPAVVAQVHVAVAPAAAALAIPLAPSATAALAARALAAAAAFAAGEAAGAGSAEVARSAYGAAAEAAESSLRAAGDSASLATAIAERALDGIVVQSMLGNIGKMFEALEAAKKGAVEAFEVASRVAREAQKMAGEDWGRRATKGADNLKEMAGKVGADFQERVHKQMTDVASKLPVSPEIKGMLEQGLAGNPELIANIREKLKDLPGEAQRDWVLEKLAGMQAGFSSGMKGIGQGEGESNVVEEIDGTISTTVTPGDDFDVSDARQGENSKRFALGGAAGAAFAATALAGFGSLHCREGSNRLGLRRRSHQR